MAYVTPGLQRALTELLRIWLPALPYAAMLLTLLAALALFLSLKNELRKASLRDRRALDEHAAHVSQALVRLNQFSQAAPSEVYVPVTVPIAHISGFNVQRRTQALRLLRRGEDVAHVAAALSVPRREIELLIRVQQLASQAARPALPAGAEAEANGEAWTRRSGRPGDTHEAGRRMPLPEIPARVFAAAAGASGVAARATVSQRPYPAPMISQEALAGRLPFARGTARRRKIASLS